MATKPSESSPLHGQLSFIEDDSPNTAATLTSAATVTSAAIDDAAVISGPNTRLRAGNAMHRAREGVIRGALETIALRGIRKLTMAEAADRGGVARATLYNHARDKQALLELVLEHEAHVLARAFTDAPTTEAALAAAAQLVAEHPALAGLREHDASALNRLASVSDGRVRQLAAEALHARGIDTAEPRLDLALRWLVSFMHVPSDPASRASQARALAKSLG